MVQSLDNNNLSRDIISQFRIKTTKVNTICIIYTYLYRIKLFKILNTYN